MQIFLFGTPGSGKTTVAEHLATRYKIPHLSFRLMVLEAMTKKTFYSDELKSLWESFEPFPKEMAFRILADHLGDVPPSSFVLEGFPKTADEASLLISWLNNKVDNEKEGRYVFVLESALDNVKDRIFKRLVCPSCSYVAANPNPNTILGNNCPNCHKSLFRRQDDIEDKKIIYRFERFNKEKEGMLEQFQGFGHLYFIDSNRPFAEVISDVMEVVDMGGR